MPWDLFSFGTAADYSAGLVAMAITAGEDIYVGNGAAGTGTIMYINEDGHIFACSGVSEDGALAELRWHKASDPDYNRFNSFFAGQTEMLTLNEMVARLNYPVKRGDSINADATNAAAKFDTCMLWIARGGSSPQLSSQPFGAIPANAKWVSITTGHTATADTWTQGAVTFENYTLDRDKNYAILASVQHGATLYAYRFAVPAGPWAGYRPGCLGGDSDLLLVPTYFSEPPVFTGLGGLNMQTLCSAGDTATAGALLIQPL